MKYITSLILALFIIGCGGNSSVPEQAPPPGDNSILVKASGLSQSVTLYESVSKQTHTIENDGNHQITLPPTQSIYNISIINSPQQWCDLSYDLDLTCTADACTAEYNPVCAKKPLAGLTCASEPCQSDRYLTFGNACEAHIDNAWLALDTECGGLEDQVAYHQQPVYVTNFSLLDIPADPFTILEKSVEGDSLTIQFEVSGGCGSHHFTLYADNRFLESYPVQQTNTIGYYANDACDSIIQVEETFDLLPIKEVYQRAYPDATGEQTVVLNDLIEYTFIIE